VTEGASFQVMEREITCQLVIAVLRLGWPEAASNAFSSPPQEE
jgi:hypothetical protein